LNIGADESIPRISFFDVNGVFRRNPAFSPMLGPWLDWSGSGR
jgi:hypothetical protein